MASIEELAAQHAAQGEEVKRLKSIDKTSDESKAAVAKLLEIKRAITALDPEHQYAIKDKKKKKKKKGPGGVNKKAARIAARQEKARKEKAAREAAAREANNYGDLPIIMSRELTGRTWTRVEEITAAANGRTVLVRARAHNIRSMSKNVFVTLRQGARTLQAVLVQEGAITKDMFRFIQSVTRESVVELNGVVRLAAQPITGCTQSDVELHASTFHVVSRAEGELPFQVADASKPGSYKEKEEEADGEQKGDDGVIAVGLNTRLNHRWIDLRTPCNQAIMRINTGVSNLFREFLYGRGFVEIHTPKINGGASEGGANCFTLNYFDKPACLAQSPQLFKQMCCACSGLERVFEVGPVFRAEDSNTHRHLCEFTGLDMEMAINEHYFEVLAMFSDLFIYIFEQLQERYSAEIEIISQMFPVEPFKFLKPSLRLTYAEGCALLAEHGLTDAEREMGCTPQSPEEDLSTPNEKLLGRIVKEKYGTDFFMMDEYPLKVRPFYTMPHPTNPKLSNSYDFFMRGEEILSGAQRIHDVELLLQRCRSEGSHGEPMSDEAIESIKGYVDSFRHGALPHGGGGVGLERVVMLFLGIPNIRLATYFARDPKRLSP